MPITVAVMERIAPQVPRREQDELHQTMRQSLMARDFDRQVAEIQARTAVRNRYTMLAIPVTKTVG